MPTTRTMLALRLGLGILFLAAGLAKLFALDVTTALIAEKGLPFAATLAVVAAFAETFAGLVLLVGARTRAVARGLLVALVFAAMVFHDPVGLPPGLAHMNAVSLTVDILVVIGLALLARWSPPTTPIPSGS